MFRRNRQPHLMLLLILLALTAAPLKAADPEANAILPSVELTRLDGSATAGTFANPSLSFEAEIGTINVRATQLRMLHLHTIDGKPSDSLELRDGHHLQGRLAEPLILEVAGQTQRFDREQLLKVKFSRPGDKSLTALAVALITLTIMEIVLGIDNIIFLAIIAGRLPAEQQPRARRLGLLAALGTRIGLLCSLSFLLGLTQPLFRLPELPMIHGIEAREITIRDLILLAGGLFLIIKSVHEIHAKLDEPVQETKVGYKAVSFAGVLVQIALIDLLFSLDSVITAIGMVDVVWIMIVATTLAMLVMLGFAGGISNFVNRHPSVKVLALAFLILIGAVLIVEAFGGHVDKGYIYFAMAFAVVVEMLNLRRRKKHSLQTH